MSSDVLPAGSAPTAKPGSHSSGLTVLWGLERQFLLLLLAVCLTLGIAYAMVTPYLWGPDEDAHLDYVQLLWETKGDPAAMAARPEPGKSVRGHAPTYYWLVAAAYGLTTGQPQEVQLIACRMVSLLLLLGEVLFAYLLARLLSPTNRFIHLAAPSFVALLPGRVWMGAVVNNDNLASFASAGLLYATARIVMLGFSAKRLVALFVFAMVAVGSKPTAWAVVVAVGVVLGVVGWGWLWRWRRVSWWQPLLVASALSAALALGGLLARGQLQRYANSLELVWDKLNAIPAPEMEPFAHQWKSFWLPLWAADAMPPEPVYWLGAVVVVPALLGLAVRFSDGMRGKMVGFLPPMVEGRRACVAMLGLALAGVWTLSLLQHLGVVAGTGSFSVPREIWPPTHARYLFPALLPISYFTTWGLARIVPSRWWVMGLAALVALLLCLQAVALYSLISHYYFWSS